VRLAETGPQEASDDGGKNSSEVEEQWSAYSEQEWSYSEADRPGYESRNEKGSAVPRMREIEDPSPTVCK
jgi:hypothetical protein